MINGTECDPVSLETGASTKIAQAISRSRAMRGKTKLIGKRLTINGQIEPHPRKLVAGEVSDYTLIGYRKKGHGDKFGEPVNVVSINDSEIVLDFVMCAEPWMKNCDQCNGAGCRSCEMAGNVQKHTTDTMPTKVIRTKTGTFL